MTGVGLAVSALISGDEKKLKYVGRSYVAEGSGWIHRELHHLLSLKFKFCHKSGSFYQIRHSHD